MPLCLIWVALSMDFCLGLYIQEPKAGFGVQPPRVQLRPIGPSYDSGEGGFSGGHQGGDQLRSYRAGQEGWPRGSGDPTGTLPLSPFPGVTQAWLPPDPNPHQTSVVSSIHNGLWAPGWSQEGEAVLPIDATDPDCGLHSLGKLGVILASGVPSMSGSPAVDTAFKHHPLILRHA